MIIIEQIKDVSDCTQAVLTLDQMGLYGLTEAVMDTESFKNLFYLFLCPKLSPEYVLPASMAQRRILDKIINTLTRKYEKLSNQKNV